MSAFEPKRKQLIAAVENCKKFHFALELQRSTQQLQSFTMATIENRSADSQWAVEVVR